VQHRQVEREQEPAQRAQGGGIGRQAHAVADRRCDRTGRDGIDPDAAADSLRASARTAALVPAQTDGAGMPITFAPEVVGMTEASSCRTGAAFGTVRSTPRALIANRRSK
jgi:hypothetical protein